jgi:ribosomal protein S3AE
MFFYLLIDYKHITLEVNTEDLREDLGDNVIPQLVMIIQTVTGSEAFSTFKSPKINRSLTKNL